MKEICSRVPKFLSNTILRSLDLKEINRNIYNASYLEFLEEETGIITGLEVTTDGSQIYVSEGIYKYMDEIIFLDMTLSIKIPNEEKEYSLNICTKLLDEEYSVSKKIYLSFKEKGFELSKFNLRNGATLQNSNYDISRFEYRYNTINTEETMYSKTGINPKILRIWSSKMLKLSKLKAFDKCVAYLCEISSINKSLLIKYLVDKLDIELKDYTNTEIISFLYEILDKEIKEEEKEEFNFETIKVD